MPDNRGDLCNMGQVSHHNQEGGYKLHQGWNEEASEGEGGERQGRIDDSKPMPYAAALPATTSHPHITNSMQSMAIETGPNATTSMSLSVPPPPISAGIWSFWLNEN